MPISSKIKKLVPISEAASFLGVSLDTLRRWDESGLLHAERSSDNTRHFSLDELEKIKFSKPLSISEAGAVLHLSPSTLRRLEKKGTLVPRRNSAGERVYTKDVLEKFLQSDYFLRQKEVEEKILRPLQDLRTLTNSRTFV